ncbi:MAG TPA: DJ-1/PfpI family protein [Polyangiaceae bacterium]|nr:DJ-1/PfpI family protein [Polyangiaceae bacterium]
MTGSLVTVSIGMLLFPQMTQLDFTGPFEVLHRIPGAKVHVLWKNLEPVAADSSLRLTPTARLDDCPPLDVVFVPGGAGQMPLMHDDAVLDFLVGQAKTARYVTSVCTGALVLGAAGLLDGYEATTHWAYTELLPLFGARPVRKRVVIDRGRITAGGVTAGIDFGLRIAAEIAGEQVARSIQLGLEYDPEPPFRSGHPDVADAALVEATRERLRGSLDERRVQSERAVAARRGRWS